MLRTRSETLAAVLTACGKNAARTQQIWREEEAIACGKLLRARSRIWREDSGGSVPKNKVLWVPKNKVLWVLDTEASGRDFELPNARAWRGLRDG